MGDEVEVISPDQFTTFPLPTYPEIKLAVGAYEKVQETVQVVRAGGHPHRHRRARSAWPRGASAWSGSCPSPPATTPASPNTSRPGCRCRCRPATPTCAGSTGPSGRLMVATPTMRDELARHGFRNISPWSRGVDTELFHPRQAGRSGRLRGPGAADLAERRARGGGEEHRGLPGARPAGHQGGGRRRAAARGAGGEISGRGRSAAPSSATELAAYFAGADVFVFPSLTDTFGLVILEAMASGTPVAAFPAPGPIDIIPDSGAGVLAPSHDRGAARSLPGLPASSTAARCGAFAERFSWRACAEEFVRNLQPYPEPEKTRFWRRLRRLARLRRGPRREDAAPQSAGPPS